VVEGHGGIACVAVAGQVDTHHRRSRVAQRRDQVTGDEAPGAGDQDGLVGEG
jgi:hypothetical protein